jgi:predicted HicB family RNase H-like nuclease
MPNLNIRLSGDLKEKVQKAAELQGLSVSAFIKKTIERFIHDK